MCLNQNLNPKGGAHLREFLDRKPIFNYIFLAVGAFLTALTLMIPSIGAVEWVSLVPAAIVFIITARDTEVHYKQMYLYGFVYYMSFGLSIFHWFINLYPLDFAGMTKPAAAVVVIVAWVGLSLLQAVFAAFMPVLLALLMRKSIISKYRILTPFIAAALFTVFEWLQTLTWMGVPWGRLAIGQTEMPLMLKSSSAFGSYFITFLIVAVNFFLALFILMKKDEKRNVCLAAGAGLVALNLLVGMSAELLEANDGEKIKAAAIQPNISSHEKWGWDSLTITKETVRKYSLAAAEEGATLIVMPETVFPYNPLKNSSIYDFITELAVECDATLVVGGFTSGEELDGNSLIFVHPDGSVDEKVYSKRHLVPFGEYVPMRKIIMTLIPPLAEISMLGEDLAPGKDSAVADTEAGRLGGLVCFDSIYEMLTVDSVRDGAEIIVLGTNDSWFLDSAAVYMHNAQAKLRATETGRYIVRAANTGISSIIDPDGRVLDEEPPLVEGYVTADVAARDSLTLYSVIGNAFVYLNIAFSSILLLSIFKDKIIPKRN